MKQLSVTLPGDRSYGITFEKGLLPRCGEAIRKVYSGGQVCVVTDSNVAPLYLETVTDSLKQAGFAVKTVVFPAGEMSKNMETLVSLYDGMLAEPSPMTRSGLIVALGGGVVGDLTGFAAATLFRGIPFVQIPTTLLAQVDSSVGGKVAVDLKQGKNLAGAFYQPRAVLIDPGALHTLPERVFRDGLAEVVKYGVLGDEKLFALLEDCPDRQALMAHMEEILYACCDDKRAFVERDERDTGDRMLLNFGHTLGHIYEKLGNYETYMHGEAVSCGMARILEIGEEQGFTRPGTARRVKALLSRFGLPVEPADVSSEALKEVLAYDKKGTGKDITVVFCRKVGESFLHRMPKAQFACWACGESEEL